MATSKNTTASKTTKPATAAKNTGWTQVPPAPKVPNYWHGHGFTLMYANPGWSVYPGTFSSKTDKPEGDPLHHERKAADAKAWAEQHPEAADTSKPKPAPKPKGTRKPPSTRTARAKAEQDAETAGLAKSEAAKPGNSGLGTVDPQTGDDVTAGK